MKVHLYLLMLSLLLAGCWDMQDIEQRSLVLGVAFDKAEDAEGGGFIMTVELPILGATAQGEGDGGVITEQSITHSTQGHTPAHMATNFEKRFWRPLFFGHLKVLVIGEELAREGFVDFIDFFDRNPHIDRRVKLLIAQDEARDILFTRQARESIASIYLNELLDAAPQTLRVITENFQDSLIRLERTGDSIVPRVRAHEDELTVGGGAVIKEYQLVGWLSENEAKAVQILYDNVEGGRIPTMVNNNPFTYSIQTAATRITPTLNAGELHVAIAINMEGSIIEALTGKGIDIPLSTIEASLNQALYDTLRVTLHKLQQEFRVDAIGVGEMVRRRFPGFWDDHKQIWNDTVFPNLEFSITPNLKIRRTGILD